MLWWHHGHVITKDRARYQSSQVYQLYQPMHQLARACRHRCGSALLSGFGIWRLRLSVKTCVENVLVDQRTMEVLQQSRDICEILFLVPQVIAAVRAGRCLLWRNYNRPHGSDFLFGFGSCSQCFGKWTSEFCTFYIIHQSSETLVYCH